MNITKVNSQPFYGTVTYSKEKVAKQIAKLKDNNPQWQIDSLIGNINTLKRRLEQQTPESSSFALDLLVTEDQVLIPTGASETDRAFSMPEYNSKSYAKFFEITIEDLNDNKKYYSSARLEDYNKKQDCFTNKSSGEKIWQEGFRQITEKAINNANSNIKDQDETIAQIINQLV